ncbi:MAG: pilus assembly protein PilP [Hydrogenophilaceae bacterium]|nr:pilus assembly protein PilP [Hydrogenophilaceae bacterium]
MRGALTLLLLGLLSGCGSQDGFDDLRQFMDEAGKKNAPKVKPLPPPRPHDTFVYQADQVPDPFSPRSLKGGQAAAGEADAGRPRSSLEEFPLEGLRITGVIERNGAFQALVVSPDNRLFAAKVGDRIGQNGGVITAISYKGMKVKERIMSAAGKWTEVTTELAKPEETTIRELKPAGK